MLVVLILSLAPVAFAAEPVIVAVIDHPLNYENKYLRNNVETAILQSTFVYEIGSDQPISLFDLNQKEVASPSLNQTRGHGTHVAGIILGLDQKKIDPLIRLVNFPFSLPAKKITLQDVVNFNFSKVGQSFANSITQIQAMLDATQPRIVNLSMSSEEARVIAGYEHDLSHSDFTAHSKLIRRIAEASVASRVRQLSELIHKNSHITFVVAAGNSALDLSTLPHPTWAHIEGENVLTVASMEPEIAFIPGLGFHLSGPSNYSTRHVDIAANGSRVQSSDFNGHLIRSSGTSFAAPKVTRALAKILEEKPSLTPAQAIQELKDNFSKISSSLKWAVKEGRALDDSPQAVRKWKTALTTQRPPTCFALFH